MEYSGDASPAATQVGNTDEPGFDEAFHRMLSLGPALDWLLVKQPNNKNLINNIKEELATYEARLRDQYGRKQTDGIMQMKAASSAVNYT